MCRSDGISYNMDHHSISSSKQFNLHTRNGETKIHAIVSQANQERNKVTSNTAKIKIYLEVDYVHTVVLLLEDVLLHGGLGVVREVELQQVKATWFDDWSTGWAYRGVIERVVSF